MPKGIPNYTNRLYMRNGQLKTLTPMDFQGLLALDSLNIENVSLHSIHEKTFMSLENLRFLSLPHNSLVAVPNLSNLSKLVALDLRHNHIAKIMKDDFAGASLSSKVLLDHNKIRSLHQEAFSSSSKITSLSLRYNLLEHLILNASYSTGLITLKVLNLGHNRIQSLAIQGAGNLKLLTISRNDAVLTIDKATFTGLQNLQRLILTYNNMEIRGDAFSGLTGLGSLDLEGRKMNNISNATFSGLSKLRSLSLDECSLMTLPLPALKSLR